MDLIGLAGLGPSLRLDTGDDIPDGLVDAALTVLTEATADVDAASGVDVELVVARTFDRKGHHCTGDPCWDRNASYSQGDRDGYLVTLAVHFPAGHPAVRDGQSALDATLSRIRRERLEAHVASLEAELAAIDASGAAIDAQLQQTRAMLDAEVAAARAALDT